MPPASTHSHAGSSSDAVLERTYSKVTWRLLPLLFACYVVASLDRVNVGFAKLQILSDLKLSQTVYGLGAGVFFIGYFIFEVPSNIILHKVGARRWIARIMVTWGILSSLTMFVASPLQFYTMRFLLGVAEAGFFPGIILYLTYWYPARRRARITALFMTGIPVSGVIGGPLSGWIMQTFAGVNNWKGWQWLFALEGLPSVLLAITVLYFLDDNIRSAKWLTESDKVALEEAVAVDAIATKDPPLATVLRDRRLWILSLIYFCLVMGNYGVSFWLPTLIKATGVKSPMDIGLLTTIPNATAAVAMVFAGRSADKRNERRWHVAIPALFGGVGLAASAQYGNSTVIAMIALTVATAGILSTLALFWSLPTSVFGGAAAAAGIAFVNSIGNLAGFVSPYLVGFIADHTGSTKWGMCALACCLVVGALLTVTAVPAASSRAAELK